MVEIRSSKVEKSNIRAHARINKKLVMHVLRILNKGDIVNLQDLCKKKIFKLLPLIDRIAEKSLFEFCFCLNVDSVISCLGSIAKHAVFETKLRQLGGCIDQMQRVIMPLVPRKRLANLKMRILNAKSLKK